MCSAAAPPQHLHQMNLQVVQCKSNEITEETG